MQSLSGSRKQHPKSYDLLYGKDSVGMMPLPFAALCNAYMRQTKKIVIIYREITQ